MNCICFHHRYFTMFHVTKKKLKVYFLLVLHTQNLIIQLVTQLRDVHLFEYILNFEFYIFQASCTLRTFPTHPPTPTRVMYANPKLPSQKHPCSLKRLYDASNHTIPHQKYLISVFFLMVHHGENTGKRRTIGRRRRIEEKFFGFLYLDHGITFYSTNVVNAMETLNGIVHCILWEAMTPDELFHSFDFLSFVSFFFSFPFFLNRSQSDTMNYYWLKVWKIVDLPYLICIPIQFIQSGMG